jgi:sporulation protein YqfC
MKASNIANIAAFLGKKLYLNTHILIADNSRLEIENVRKILEYSENYIRVMTSTLILSVWGNSLSADDYNMSGIVICGEISSIEFERVREKDDA